MVVPFKEYFLTTFSEVSLNALIVAVIFAMLVMDMRKLLKIDYAIEKIKNPLLKVCVILLSYLLVIPLGFVGLFIVISIIWLVSYI